MLIQQFVLRTFDTRLHAAASSVYKSFYCSGGLISNIYIYVDGQPYPHIGDVSPAGVLVNRFDQRSFYYTTDSSNIYINLTQPLDTNRDIQIYIDQPVENYFVNQCTVCFRENYGSTIYFLDCTKAYKPNLGQFGHNVPIVGNQAYQDKVLKWSNPGYADFDQHFTLINEGTSYDIVPNRNNDIRYSILNQQPASGKWYFEYTRHNNPHPIFFICEAGGLPDMINKGHTGTNAARIAFDLSNSFVFYIQGKNDVSSFKNKDDIQSNVALLDLLEYNSDQQLWYFQNYQRGSFYNRVFEDTSINNRSYYSNKVFGDNGKGCFGVLIDLDNRWIEIRNIAKGTWVRFKIYWDGPTAFGIQAYNTMRYTSFNLGYRKFFDEVPEGYKPGYGVEISRSQDIYIEKDRLLSEVKSTESQTLSFDHDEFNLSHELNLQVKNELPLSFSNLNEADLQILFQEEQREIVYSVDPYKKEGFMPSKYGGYGYIKSIVLKGTNTTTPIGTYVALVEVDDIEFIKITKSDPITGEFEFTFLSEERDYNVLAFDPDKGWVTAIVGPIKAKRMPNTEGLTFNEYDYF